MKLRTTILLMLAAFRAFGQTTTTTTPPSTTATTATSTAVAATTPVAWIVGTGVERNTYGNTPNWLPFVNVGACWAAFCEMSTLEMGSGSASVRQDIGYKMKCSADGGTCLIAIVGGGLTTTTTTGSVLPSTVNLGNVGGGFLVRSDLGAFIKPLQGKGLTAHLEAREATVTSLGVKPQFAVGLEYRFSK